VYKYVFWDSSKNTESSFGQKCMVTPLRNTICPISLPIVLNHTSFSQNILLSANATYQVIVSFPQYSKYHARTSQSIRLELCTPLSWTPLAVPASRLCCMLCAVLADITMSKFSQHQAFRQAKRRFAVISVHGMRWICLSGSYDLNKHKSV
jgi:hypothetical protein